MGYVYPPPTCRTYQRHRAACSRGAKHAVRVPAPGVLYCTYRVPCGTTQVLAAWIQEKENAPSPNRLALAASALTNFASKLSPSQRSPSKNPKSPKTPKTPKASGGSGGSVRARVQWCMGIVSTPRVTPCVTQLLCTRCLVHYPAT